VEFVCREEEGKSILSSDGRSIDMSFKSEERLPLKFSKLVEHVSRKTIPPGVKSLIVEVMVSDEEDEDVEVCIMNTLILLVLPLTTRCRFLSLSSVFDCRDRRVRACLTPELTT